MSCGLDMCCRTRYALTGENSYHIEFDRRENISILQSKNIEQTLVCISTTRCIFSVTCVLLKTGKQIMEDVNREFGKQTE